MPAPTPIAYPLTGGQRHSPSSAELKIALPSLSFILSGWQAINYAWKLTPEPVYGQHPDPIGWTLGKAEYTADLEVLLAEYNYLLAQFGPGFAVTTFAMTCTHSENGFDTIADEILGCRLVGGEAGIQAGGNASAQTRKIPLIVTKIKPNGVDPLLIPLQGIAT